MILHLRSEERTEPQRTLYCLCIFRFFLDGNEMGLDGTIRETGYQSVKIFNAENSRTELLPSVAALVIWLGDAFDKGKKRINGTSENCFFGVKKK